MNIYLRKVASEGINHHVEHCIFVLASRVLFFSRCPTFRVSPLSSWVECAQSEWTDQNASECCTGDGMVIQIAPSVLPIAECTLHFPEMSFVQSAPEDTLYTYHIWWIISPKLRSASSIYQHLEMKILWARFEEPPNPATEKHIHVHGRGAISSKELCVGLRSNGRTMYRRPEDPNWV